MEPQARYVQLGQLVAEMPNFNVQGALTPEMTRWLGRAAALLAESPKKSLVYSAELSSLQPGLLTQSPLRGASATHLAVLMHTALTEAELLAPAGAQGAFVPAGGAFSAMTAIGKVLQMAKKDVLIVDPYMDEKALTDYAPLMPEKLALRLLADQKDHKQTLKPASTRWITEYGAKRPLEARLAAPRSLHDRAILIDGVQAWSLTQSLNAFAVRSPATITRLDDETSSLKIAAYEAMWSAATPL